jgi:hypothetical protein
MLATWIAQSQFNRSVSNIVERKFAIAVGKLVNRIIFYR